jgi:hypothetical protein
MASDRLKKALAENTAHLRVLADRYTVVLAQAELEIKKEEAKETPSQWKIEALINIRQRVEENLARFKAGPDWLPGWMSQPRSE